MPYETAIPSISNLVGIAVICVFGLVIWLHARFYLAKEDIVVTGLTQSDGMAFGGTVSGDSECGDGGGHGSCGAGGH